MELTQSWEVEDAVALASACEDADVLVQKVTLLRGELAEAHRAREVVKEKFCNLFDTSANGARYLVVSEMLRQEQFK
jgi:hypothetical protein